MKKEFIKFIVIGTLALGLLNPYITLFQEMILGKSYFLLDAGFIATLLFLIYRLWTYYIWKIESPLVQWVGNLIGLESIPNINGNWEVKFLSSYNYDWQDKRYVTEGTGDVKITQNYDNLVIEGRFNLSRFNSIRAELFKRDHRWFLMYLYENQPTDEQLKNLPHGGHHKGFCLMELVDNESSLEGFYSNDENRKTRGSIRMIRK